MYVCICHAVRDLDVERAIEDGADSVAAVTRHCKAGGDCGSCHQYIEDLLEEHAERRHCLPVIRPAA